MAHYQNQYAAPASQVDEYGNPIRTDQYGNTIRTDEYGNPIRTDEFGNPIHHMTGTAGSYGSGGYDTTTLQGMSHDVTGTGAHGVSGKLHRSGSSSSSSSEDDGHGGRRKKKGLTGKIKEKIPGVGHKDHRSNTSATTPYGYDEGQLHHQEKKGVMEKIKEKLPGHH
uniref:DHN2 n=1 Tax=Corylus mandshurica TaxID=139401 RepID=G8DZR9_9ROSI|nr:DHN2 [Corylus mandshurica]